MNALEVESRMQLQQLSLSDTAPTKLRKYQLLDEKITPRKKTYLGGLLNPNYDLNYVAVI